MQADDHTASIRTEVIGEVAGLEPADINAARDLVAALTGQNDVGTVPFSTEAGLFQALGTDVVVCGPGSIAQAHRPDEFVSLDQLSQCIGMLEKLAATANKA
jgi:acetylornithine deacetylase